MYKNDISNSVEPRMLLVFEGLLGLHTDARSRAEFTKHLKPPRRWSGEKTRAENLRKAIRTFTLNEQMMKIIWDTVWRHQYAIDVVTFLDPDLREPLIEYLDDQSLPIGNVTQAEKLMLARTLNYRPDVVGVFYGDTNDRFTFGSKGYYVNPSSPRLIGAM